MVQFVTLGLVSQCSQGIGPIQCLHIGLLKGHYASLHGHRKRDRIQTFKLSIDIKMFEIGFELGKGLRKFPLSTCIIFYDIFCLDLLEIRMTYSIKVVQ